MAWTQADIDALDTAIKNAKLEVQFADRRVRYRAMADLLTARNLAVMEVAKASAKTQGGSARFSLVDFT